MNALKQNRAGEIQREREGGRRGRVIESEREKIEIRCNTHTC